MDITVERNSAVHAMIVFQRAARVIDLNVGNSIKQADLTSSQFGVLDVLYTKGEMSVSDLISKVLGTAGNMTVILKNMERDGLIYRKSADCDKRKSVIALTADGRMKFEEVLPPHRQEIEQVFSVLSEEDRTELIRLLKHFKNYN